MADRMHHIAALPEEIAPYVLLPGDPHRVPKVAALWDESHFIADNREHVTYTGTYKGMPISCTSTGMGCPSTAIAIEELARCGARTLLRMGTCGGISPQVQPGDFVIFDSACRFEGTTKLYAPVEYPAAAHYECVQAAIAVARRESQVYHVGTSRCIDGIYTNLPEKDTSFGGYRLHNWDYFMEDMEAMRVLAGDMESAAVMVLSRLFGLRGGCVCMCAANLLDSWRKGESMDFNRLPYSGDLEARLSYLALETMYELYRNDLKQEKVP